MTKRRFNTSAFNGYHRTPSDYSTVMCCACGRHWRTKSGYVDRLQSAPEEWHNMRHAELIKWFDAQSAPAISYVVRSAIATLCGDAMFRSASPRISPKTIKAVEAAGFRLQMERGIHDDSTIVYPLDRRAFVDRAVLLGVISKSDAAGIRRGQLMP